MCQQVGIDAVTRMHAHAAMHARLQSQIATRVRPPFEGCKACGGTRVSSMSRDRTPGDPVIPVRIFRSASRRRFAPCRFGWRLHGRQAPDARTRVSDAKADRNDTPPACLPNQGPGRERRSVEQLKL
ncbi:hypothetical protein GCM10010399_47610 [Dactylosporangium fulvum]